MTVKTIRRISAVIAALGFLLMLTETVSGGPWIGNFIGVAMLIVGTEVFRRTSKA